MADNKHECPTCKVVFNSGVTLNSHKLTCVRQPITLSFYSAWRGADGAAKEPIEEEPIEKILPPSQPLVPCTAGSSEQAQPSLQDVEADTNPNYLCDICQKSLPTSRGLKSHRTSCLKKHQNRQPGQGPSDPVSIPATATTTTVVSEDVQNQAEGERELTQTIQSNAVWGEHSAEDLILTINEKYDEVVTFQKNLFKLPSGAAGKRFLKEKTRLIEIWNEGKQPLCQIALKMVMLMPALLMQKPCRKSTAKQHSEYINKRLDSWENGDFDLLMKESRAIQHRLRENRSKHETEEHAAKVFAKLMLQGKVHAALRVLDKSANLGIAKMSEKTMEELLKLHPEAKEAAVPTLKEGEVPYFDPVIFTNINEASIAKAALRTRGAAGPSGLDADQWRRMLASKNYGATGKELRTAVAKMTRKLCTQEIINPTEVNSLEAYAASRLVPLEKEPSGIRPIGIGEVLRRIVGKTIVAEIKPEIMESAGSLQLCGGQKAGCEAAAHAMRQIYEAEETDAVLFIDASNAFNSLNRQALLHNIKYLCPPMATYLSNCYNTPARLFVTGGKEILSAEGTTQGCPMAMPSYGIGILPLLLLIKENDEMLKLLAYADDIGGGSRLENLRRWWDRVVHYGPMLGYYPKPSKSWLVVKPEKEDEARRIFEGTGIQITTEGRKYLGGFVGTREGAINYVNTLQEEWLEQLEELTKIAKSEPQAAYSAFTAGFRHKITYFIRTIPNLAEVLLPLDKMVDEKFIPAISEGHVISADDRKLLSLPVRMGGLGIPMFGESSNREFQNSLTITEKLRANIVAQESMYVQDREAEKAVELKIKQERKTYQENLLTSLREKMSKEQLRGNDIAQMKGASSWLTSLPLQHEGYVLNKREFFDSIALRYRWDMKNLPTNCVCGQKFTMDHAMQCANGGYIIRRHNKIRDLFAHFLNDVAYGVHTEPSLQPLTGERLETGANVQNDARPDIAARGFWQDCATAFFDVKVFNPFAGTHINNSLESVFKTSEKNKKKLYNERIIRVEHGSFTPIVISAFGGFGYESNIFVKKLIEKLAVKKGEEISVVANYVRTKVSFELVRSQVACVRGARKMQKMTVDTGEMSIATANARLQED